MTQPWWHPIGDGDPQVEPDDDGLVECPHCRHEGCARCQWAGVIPAPEPEESDV